MHPLVEERLAEIAEVCRRRHVQRLELFGSAAEGRFDPASSDFDFLVQFEAAPPGGLFDAFFGLREDLRGVFGRPVDVVMARAIRNPYFLEAVNRARTVVYAA